MHFTPNRNDIVPNYGTLLLTLNGSVIKRVIATKFLGVIINDKLKWQSHISYLNSKLKCETANVLNHSTLEFQDFSKRAPGS